MESRNTKLLHALKDSGATGIIEAYDWVQGHRHEFSKDVYGPVLVEVHTWKPRLSCLLIIGICTNSFISLFWVKMSG